MTALWRVKCAGHPKPGAGANGGDCYVDGYYVAHQLNVLQLVRAAERLSEHDWEDGPRCLLDIILDEP